MFFCLVFSSCKKENISNVNLQVENAISSKPIEEQRAFVRENFKLIMKEFSPLLKDNSFKSYLNSEIAKKFDGDFNVLIKTIVENPEYKTKLNCSRVISLLNKFKNIEGRTYYPQIFIPYFDRHTNTNYRTTNEATTEVVFYDGNEDVDVVPSYVYNEDGELVLSGNMIDETYAQQNPVLVISLNESVDDLGNPPNPPTDNGSGVVAPTITNFKMEKLKVMDRKESWLAGDSEIAIRALCATWNHLLNGFANQPHASYNNIRTTDDKRGFEIKKYPRSIIGHPGDAGFAVHYPLHQDWNITDFYFHPIAYTYVVFEADNWPTGTKVCASTIVSVQNPSYKYDMFEFRSADACYGANGGGDNINLAIYGSTFGLNSQYQFLYYDGHVVETGDIKFNTKKY